MELGKKVLEYWHLMETLTPNDFPKIGVQRNPKSVRFACQASNWTKELIPDSDKKSYPEISDEIDYCVGAVSKKSIVSSFFDALKLSCEQIEEEEGEVCLFGFMTDTENCYIENSFKISPYIWSIRRIIKKDSITGELFNDECKNKKYIDILNSKEPIKTKIQEIYRLLTNEYLDFIHEDNSFSMKTTVFWSNYINGLEKANDSNKIKHESAFMSSFLLADLELVLKNFDKNPLIKEYTEILHNHSISRIDIKKDMKEVSAILSEKYMPRAKWPGKYSPATMQQIAINYACEENELLAVNGPPGTGKTTLLKEIIAQKVYETALAICDYDKADSAFEECSIPQSIENANLKTYYRPKEKLTNYGILVCSCNNAAVENISLELPDMKSLKKEISEKEYLNFYEQDDIYFTKSANKLLKTKNKDLNAWGLISVPLGKSDNIYNFVKNCEDEIINRGNSEIEKKQSSDGFKNAKREFLEQKRIVEKKFSQYQSCINSEFLGPLQNRDVKSQYKTPWDIKDLDLEREKLFNKAIKLRKEFLLSSKCVRTNMRILFHIWGYKDNEMQEVFFTEDTKRKIFNDLFQTLFLVVPVISTTFASVAKFLKYMEEPKKIGLLIVDEAGQASPQNIIGALYRSKQAVIVGDPMQVEPVVTIPKYFNGSIDDYDLEPYFSQKESVQTFADRMSKIGSYIINEYSDSGKTWVGCPLLVHRRCIDPMFSISNKLSYNSTMYNQTIPDKEFDKVAMFDKSYWFDIRGEDKGKNHSVEEQALFVVNTIKEKKKNDSKYSVYVISPFSTVVRRIEQLLQEQGIKNIDCGTVHRFQGKQAEEVFFVLGCSNKTKGAVEWVNSNIVNVAVTRAKQRIYIVGDYDLWSGNKNFKIAQEFLPPESISEPEKKQKSIYKEIKRFINQTQNFEEKYNFIITDKLYLIKTKIKCWNKTCNQLTDVYAIAAKNYLSKKDEDIKINMSEAFTMFYNIKSYDSEFAEIIRKYETLQQETSKYNYLINKCAYCNLNQTEQYLFSDNPDKTTFGKDITAKEFELVEIELKNDVQINASIFKTFLWTT